MIIFILLLGTILSGILTGVNHYTMPIIRKNMEIKIKTSVLDAFNIVRGKDNAEEIFLNNIEIIKKNDVIFYISRKQEVGFEISGTGLWGPILGIIALKPDLKTIKGITIIHQEETPGLGGRIAEKEFLNKFRNKKVFPELKILSPGKAKKENEVDGITGATMTIKSFEELINRNVREALDIW